MTRVSFLNARLIDPASGFDAVAALHLADGRIVGRGEAPAGFVADETIDARGQWIVPGLVDLSARLGEPGGEHKKKLQSELRAAAAGGVTTVCCTPDTDPTLDEPGLVHMLRHKADAIGLARVRPLGALTRGLAGQELSELALLHDAGCIAFSQADTPILDTRVLLRAMQYAATYGFTLRLRPEDGRLAAGGVAHEGEVATRLGLPGIPVTAETVAIATILILMRDTGARVHLERLSSAEGLAMVRAAKAEGLPLSADVSIQHVHLADIDIGFFDPTLRLAPPLRSVRDRSAIQQALVDGTVDAICSDHHAIGRDAKLLPFGEAQPGATALELLLPLTVMWAAQAQVPLTTALARVTCAPAALIGSDAGTLAIGASADLAVFDPSIEWQPTPASLHSQGKHTPFHRTMLRGRVRRTLLAGRVVYHDEA
jgi:dihydroorotase